MHVDSFCWSTTPYHTYKIIFKTSKYNIIEILTGIEIEASNDKQTTNIMKS
jgi:hypothetical protein